MEGYDGNSCSFGICALRRTEAGKSASAILAVFVWHNVSHIAIAAGVLVVCLVCVVRCFLVRNGMESVFAPNSLTVTGTLNKKEIALLLALLVVLVIVLLIS